MTGKHYQNDAMRTNDGGATSRLHAMAHLCDEVPVQWECDFGEVIDAALGLNGEAGEVADMIKKWVFHNHDLDVEHLEKELGDVMWYVALMCNAIGTDMDAIMRQNIDKLKARYPEGFDPELSKNRKAGDI